MHLAEMALSSIRAAIQPLASRTAPSRQLFRVIATRQCFGDSRHQSRFDCRVNGGRVARPCKLPRAVAHQVELPREMRTSVAHSQMEPYHEPPIRGRLLQRPGSQFPTYFLTRQHPRSLESHAAQDTRGDESGRERAGLQRYWLRRSRSYRVRMFRAHRLRGEETRHVVGAAIP